MPSMAFAAESMPGAAGRLSPSLATLAALAAVSALALLDACGMIQHNEIAHRALRLLDHGQPRPWLAPLLRRRMASLQAGAPAPDFGYVCFADRDAGEAMHWLPFQARSYLLLATILGRRNPQRTHRPTPNPAAAKSRQCHHSSSYPFACHRTMWQNYF